MPKKILIIDDDAEHVDVTANVLKHIGKFSVATSSDSEKALETIRNERPDLVLLDIMMPRVDGFTICKEIKEAEDLKHVKIIVYSAKIFDADKKKALRLGADAYISKVIESNKLIDQVNQLLNPS